MQLYRGARFIQPFYKSSEGNSRSLDIMSAGTPIIMYRYFMLKIYESWGDSTLQFSKMQFIDNNGKSFIYPTETSTEIGMENGVLDATCFPGENLTNVLVNDNTITEFGKACFIKRGYSLSNEHPIRFKFDLKSECLNISIYNRWHWYTSNDTATETGRNMKRFELFFSNKGDMYDSSCWNSIVTGGEQNNSDIRKNRVLAFTSNYFDI